MAKLPHHAASPSGKAEGRMAQECEPFGLAPGSRLRHEGQPCLCSHSLAHAATSYCAFCRASTHLCDTDTAPMGVVEKQIRPLQPEPPVRRLITGLLPKEQPPALWQAADHMCACTHTHTTYTCMHTHKQLFCAAMHSAECAVGQAEYGKEFKYLTNNSGR